MSLRPHTLEPVPEETARVARAAFPKGNPYLLLRDTLGTIFQDDDFAALLPAGGPTWPPALAPGACHASCSSAKISPIAKPPRQCGLVLTGNICSGSR